MVVKRSWYINDKNGYRCRFCTGYFLFGIIPIYISIGGAR